MDDRERPKPVRTCFPSRLSRVRVPSPAPLTISEKITVWCRFWDDTDRYNAVVWDHLFPMVHRMVHTEPETGG
jgi:hypothetical protein